MNQKDILVRRGHGRAAAILPQILGGDGAGVVVETGAAAGALTIGARVCVYPVKGCGGCELCATDRDFMCAGLRVLGEGEHGTYAEYVRVPARSCFLIPAELSFEEAAALPSAHLAAWRLLVTLAKLKPGNHVLVRGIGGELANAAMQIAILLGCHVIVTSDLEEKLRRAVELGAGHGIHGIFDRCGDLAKEVRRLTAKRGVDVVVDCIGGDGWAESLACIARGGCLVSAGALAEAKPPTDLRRIFWHHLRIFGATLGSRGEFQQVLNFIQTTKTRPIIDGVYALKEAALAHRDLEEGRTFGKLVLHMDH